MTRSLPRATSLLALAAVVALVVAPGSPASDDAPPPPAAAPGAAAGEHTSNDGGGSPAGERRSDVAELSDPTDSTDPDPDRPASAAAAGEDTDLGPAAPSSARPAAARTPPDTPDPVPDDDEVAVPPMEPTGLSDEGFEVAPGGPTAGEGPTVRYTVEVEPGAGEELGRTVAIVEEALHDPRSWAHDVRFERTGDPDDADIRVLLASPGTVDRLCAEAGLDTFGVFSCWNQTFAALNSMRWNHGADAFGGLDTYRRYLVNHEVGHGLGHAHVDCPGTGELAPVMMQQTMGTDGCHANGWAYPEVSGP